MYRLRGDLGGLGVNLCGVGGGIDAPGIDLVALRMNLNHVGVDSGSLGVDLAFLGMGLGVF